MITKVKLYAVSLFFYFILITSASADIQLRFGVYAADKPISMVRKFRPILNALEPMLTKELGEPTRISLQVAHSYDQGIDNIVSGKVDFARIGPASYITSKERNPNIQLLAMENKKGLKTFFGIICVHKNSDITKLNQLKGLSFAFGNQNSTIGRFLSQQMLLNNGILANDLSAYEYLGRHDRVGAAVGAKQFNAGALKESAFIKLKEAGAPIRELTRFPNITQPWVISSTTDERVAMAIKTALLNFTKIESLKKLKISGFFPVEDNDYASIREAIQNNKKFFQ